MLRICPVILFWPILDPWRQKSRDYTREQTPANSFAQPESRRTYPLTGVCSGADSGVVGDSPTQFARICSHHEPSHNSEQSSMEDGRLNGENELDMLIVCDESSRCNGVDALLLNNEEESILHEDGIYYFFLHIECLCKQFSSEIDKQ